MNEIIVGKQMAAMVGREEGIHFDLSGNGAMLIYNFNRPNEQEIAAMQAGQSFEIRFAQIGSVLWVLSKCGSLKWMEAPYTPMLSKLDGLNWLLPADKGLLLTLIMTEAQSGIVRSLRGIGLGNRFSVMLLRAVRELTEQPFDPLVYYQEVDHIQNIYTTKQLVSMARNYYKIGG